MEKDNSCTCVKCDSNLNKKCVRHIKREKDTPVFCSCRNHPKYKEIYDEGYFDGWDDAINCENDPTYWEYIEKEN